MRFNFSKLRYPLILLTIVAVFLSFFVFELPFNLLRPVFHQDDIKLYAVKYQVDPILITAMIKVESNFFHRAKSEAGAVGLMQPMPATALEISPEVGYESISVSDLLKPTINIHLGTYYISKLLKEYEGNNILALAAYNAGTGNVALWYKQNPMMSVELEDIPFPETKNYVREVLKTYRWIKLIREMRDLLRGRVH